MAPPGIRLSPCGAALIISVTILGFIYFTSTGSEVVSMRQLLIASIDVAEKGGDKVREIRQASRDLGVESKGDTKEGAKMLVSEGDFASNRAMVYPLRKAFPDILVVSEEKEEEVLEVREVRTTNAEVDNRVFGDDLVNVKDITIWIDPLDATQEYSEGLTEFVTTMVCVAVKGRPIIGVIHMPFEGKTHWAWVGHGTNIEVVPKDLEGDSIIVSRSHAGSVEKVAHDAFGEGSVVIPAGGAGFKTMSLFRKDASLYVHTTLIKKWDICAGNAILDAHKGSMTSLQGENIDYTSQEVKHPGGVIASLKNHAKYVEQLGEVLKGA